MTSKENTGNGLDLKNIKSETFPIEEFEFKEFESKVKEYFKDNGLFIVYLDYKVIIGKYENNDFIACGNEKFEPKYIQKIRVFNKNKELLLYRSEGKLKGRIRVDNIAATDCDIIEADQVIFGTTANVSKGFTLITETRGTEIILPYEESSVDENQNRTKIKTRNYIDYNELGQAGYVDSRFVKFTFGIDNKPIGEK